MGYDNLQIIKNDKYIKINKGEIKTIHIVTKSEDVQVSFNHFDQATKKSSPCNNDKSCAHCMDGVKRNQRFTIQAIDRESGKQKEFTFGPMIGDQIREIAVMLKMDDKTIHDVDLRIKASNGDRISYAVMQCAKPKEAPSPNDTEAGTAQEPLSKHHDEEGVPF